MSTKKTNKKIFAAHSYTTGKIERETGTKFNVPAETKLSKYFADNGLPAAAKLLEKMESINKTP